MAKQRAKYTAKITYPLIVNGRQLPYQYSLEDSADLSVRAKPKSVDIATALPLQATAILTGKRLSWGF